MLEAGSVASKQGDAIVVAGGGYLARILSSGELDSSFTAVSDYSIFAFTSDGARDESFGTSGVATFPSAHDPGYSGNTRRLLVLGDGSIIVHGSGQAFGPSYREVLKVTADGMLDTSWAEGGRIPSVVDPTMRSSA